MTVDYIVSSLPPLAFGRPAPLTWERFVALAGRRDGGAKWREIETLLRNAVAEARGGGARWRRPTGLCSPYWTERVKAAFAEKDVGRRDEMLDRVWWDAAGELTSPVDPLGAGALLTYAVRLGIALKRDRISDEKGNEVFDGHYGEDRRGQR